MDLPYHTSSNLSIINKPLLGGSVLCIITTYDLDTWHLGPTKNPIPSLWLPIKKTEEGPHHEKMSYGRLQPMENQTIIPTFYRNNDPTLQQVIEREDKGHVVGQCDKSLGKG